MESMLSLLVQNTSLGILMHDERKNYFKKFKKMTELIQNHWGTGADQIQMKNPKSNILKQKPNFRLQH